MLDPRRMRAFAQGVEKRFGQIELRAHPALARAMREIEVKPQKLATVLCGSVGIVLTLAEPVDDLVRVDRPSGKRRQEPETADHARRTRAVGLQCQI
ncbi:hypothetical protein QF001_001807 [Paraburkholderia youngii]